MNHLADSVVVFNNLTLGALMFVIGAGITVASLLWAITTPVRLLANPHAEPGWPALWLGLSLMAIGFAIEVYTGGVSL